jgi:hypothetical protein
MPICRRLVINLRQEKTMIDLLWVGLALFLMTGIILTVSYFKPENRMKRILETAKIYETNSDKSAEECFDLAVKMHKKIEG